jgi:hypothetical protein
MRQFLSRMLFVCKKALGALGVAFGIWPVLVLFLAPIVYRSCGRLNPFSPNYGAASPNVLIP